MTTLLPGGARGKMVHKNSQELRPARRSRVPGTSSQEYDCNFFLEQGHALFTTTLQMLPLS